MLQALGLLYLLDKALTIQFRTMVSPPLENPQAICGAIDAKTGKAIPLPKSWFKKISRL